MFTAEQIQERLCQRPFQSVRLVMSDGVLHDIEDPDLTMVGRRGLVIGYAKPARPKLYYRLVRVALDHIVTIDDLPPKL